MPRKDGEMGSSAAPSGEKPGDFDPNRAAFGKKLPTLRRERPTGERVRRLAISTPPPLDVTANDESDKLNCADNELDGLNLSHLPALCNLNRSLNRHIRSTFGSKAADGSSNAAVAFRWCSTSAATSRADGANDRKIKTKPRYCCPVKVLHGKK